MNSQGHGNWKELDTPIQYWSLKTIPATCYLIRFNKVKISLKFEYLLNDGLFFKDNINHWLKYPALPVEKKENVFNRNIFMNVFFITLGYLKSSVLIFIDGP